MSHLLHGIGQFFAVLLMLVSALEAYSAFLDLRYAYGGGR